jgi:CheY-like chemotaxis protein
VQHEHSILVVEDDAEVRKALTELLTDRGLKIWRARDGREALRKLRTRRKPCLILLDLMMPGINGWEFLELHRNRKALASIPLVLMTAWIDTEPAQARAMIPKPIDVPRLLRTVRRVLSEEERKRLSARDALRRGQRAARARKAS